MRDRGEKTWRFVKREMLEPETTEKHKDTGNDPVWNRRWVELFWRLVQSVLNATPRGKKVCSEKAKEIKKVVPSQRVCRTD